MPLHRSLGKYPYILLTTTGEDWPELNDNLNINDYIKARDDYILWTTEHLLQRFDRKTQGTLCQETLNQPGQIIKLDKEGVFYRRNGDTVQRFECPKRTAELESSLDICYHDIPLANNEGFVKPETRTLTTFSAPIPCNQHYGLKIVTEERVWIEIKRTIHQIAEPLDWPIVWLLCCHPHPAADRVNRRHRRLNLKGKRHDSDDVIDRMELANVKVDASMEPDF